MNEWNLNINRGLKVFLDLGEAFLSVPPTPTPPHTPPPPPPTHTLYVTELSSRLPGVSKTFCCQGTSSSNCLYSWFVNHLAILCSPSLPHKKPSPLSQLAAAAAKSLQSCPTLYDPIDSSPPGSPVPGILQARTLEWGAIAFSEANLCVWQTNWSFMDSKRQGFYRDFVKKNSEVHVKVKCESVSCLVRLLRTNSFATPWTAAHQAPLSVEFSRQKYCSCCCSLFRGSSQLRDQIWSPALQADSLLSESSNIKMVKIYVHINLKSSSILK